jgi:hypothetical protein
MKTNKRIINIGPKQATKLRGIISNYPYNEIEVERCRDLGDGRYFRLNVHRHGDLDEIENIFTPNRRYEALIKRCKELIKEEAVSMLEVQYGNIITTEVDWFILYETEYTK